MLIQELLQLRTRIALFNVLTNDELDNFCQQRFEDRDLAGVKLPGGLVLLPTGHSWASSTHSLKGRHTHTHETRATDNCAPGTIFCLHRTPPPHVYVHTRAVEHFFVYVRVIAVLGLPTVEGDWRVSPEQSGAEQRAQSLHERTRRRRCAPLLAPLHYFLSDHQDDM